jgi:ATP-dependent Lon protease
MLLQLEWLAQCRTPTATSSDTLTLSDFLANSESQRDSDQYGLENVMRQLMEHLAVIRLRALIAQAPEIEQARPRKSHSRPE